MVVVPGGSYERGEAGCPRRPRSLPPSTREASVEELEAARPYSHEPPDYTKPSWDECPRAEVYVDGFYIDKHKVSISAYRKCVRARACGASRLHGVENPIGYEFRDAAPMRRWPFKADEKCNWRPAGNDSLPVNCVSWFDAERYCKWLGKRLATEAEWEKAARGTDRRRYPWGDGPPPVAAECNETTPVTAYPERASPYGALQMTDSVAEWVSDWYRWDYYWANRGNPIGPGSGKTKVVRGGCVGGGATVRTSERRNLPPASRGTNVGFRCARDVR
jgi:formylglycine-generating enzyme required for sulfatase activity